ncbi:MAG: replication-associated recombination protein A, partial [Pseudomonadota bacterium]
PTGLMKDLGYGEGYTYDHGTEERFSGQNYFPDSLGERPHFYEPSDQGREADYKARLKHLAHLRAELTKGDRSE